MAQRMQSLAFRIPSTIADEIDHRADISGEPRSEIARHLLIRGLKDEQEEMGWRMTDERLERIERALARLVRFISAAEAEAE